jgi:hypothetical protein
MTDPTLLRMQKRKNKNSAALKVGVPAAVVVAALGAAAVWGLTRPGTFATNQGNATLAAAATSNGGPSPADNARRAVAASQASAPANATAAAADAGTSGSQRMAEAAPAPRHGRAHAARHAAASANDVGTDTGAVVSAPIPPATPAQASAGP